MEITQLSVTWGIAFQGQLKVAKCPFFHHLGLSTSGQDQKKGHQIGNPQFSSSLRVFFTKKRVLFTSGDH